MREKENAALLPPYSTRSRLDQLLFLIKTHVTLYRPQYKKDLVVTSNPNALNDRKPSHYEMSLTVMTMTIHRMLVTCVTHCGLWLLHTTPHSVLLDLERQSDLFISISFFFLNNNGPRHTYTYEYCH